jgi:hypothetical protein
MREFPMAGVDLSTRFEQIPVRAMAASDQVRVAGQRGQEELRTAASSARNRATTAADNLQGTGATGAATVSSHWQDVRAKWQAHVAAVAADLDQAGDEMGSAMYYRTRAALLNP